MAAGLAELRDVPLGLRARFAGSERGRCCGCGARCCGFFSRWWQIESLYRANAKYRPIWEPRYLLFEKSSEIPRIGLASARAEGFITAPSLPALFRRRHARVAAVPSAPKLPPAERGGKG